VSAVTKKLFLILLLGAGLRVVDLLTENSIQIDGVSYALMGQAFSQGNWAEALKGVFPPFYPVLICLFHPFVPDLEMAARLVSTVLGLGLIWVCFHFFRDLMDERKALWGALFIAIQPYLVRYSAQALSEATATILFTLALFLFYRGWTREDRRQTTLSAVLLGLMYLTRPEYIVYPAPLVILLLARRRFLDAGLFVLFFFVIVFPYLYYMKVDTGMWILSKKAMLMKASVEAHQEASQALPKESLYLVPSRPFVAYLRNVPLVMYHFAEAMFVPFFLLMIVGFKRSAASFRTLTIAIVTTHVLTIALVTSSIRRFSVPFIPFMMIFAVEGFDWARAVLDKPGTRMKIFRTACIIAFLVCIWEGITFGHKARNLDKQAGLYIMERDSGATIAARLPLTAFYAKSKWVGFHQGLARMEDCSQLNSAMERSNISYIVVDDKTNDDYPAIFQCMVSRSYLVEFKDGKDFVRLYRIDLNRR